MKRLRLFGLSLCICFISIGVFSITSNASFTDVTKEHWAYEDIIQMQTKGYIKGYVDGTFKPEANVTRSEFAQFLARAIPSDLRANVPFKDVPSDNWAYEAVSQGIALGFIDTKEYYNKLDVEKPMTRGEIVTWLSKGLVSVNSQYSQALKDTQNTILPIKEWYTTGIDKKLIPYVAVAMGTNIMNGKPDYSFDLKANTTRAEVATMLIRYLAALEKQPSEFHYLNELREVGTTGTNIKSMSWDYLLNTSGTIFDLNYAKKNPMVATDGSVKYTFQNVILTDIHNDNKSIYSRMFQLENKNRYSGVLVNVLTDYKINKNGSYYATSWTKINGSSILQDLLLKSRTSFNLPVAPIIPTYDYYYAGKNHRVWLQGVVSNPDFMIFKFDTYGIIKHQE